MEHLPLPPEDLIAFDALYPGCNASFFDDIGLPPDDLEPAGQPVVQEPLNPTIPDTIVATEIAPTRASFNSIGRLVTWRGFQVTHSNQEVLERLLIRFPQTLDRLSIHGTSLLTYLLDRLASLILEMQSLSLHTLRAEDLDRLKCEINDLSTIGFDLSPLRSRLDLIIRDHRIAMLRLEVTLRHQEYSQSVEERSKLQEIVARLKTQLQKYESAIENLEGMMTSAAKARDTAVGCLENLAMPPLQFDTSWPLTYDLL